MKQKISKERMNERKKKRKKKESQIHYREKQDRKETKITQCEAYILFLFFDSQQQ
jgi:hypothetical protein